MMQDTPNTLMPDIYEHPHASIVRECLIDLVKRLQHISPRCSLKFYEPNNQQNTTVPRERVSLEMAVGSELLHPVYVRFERRGHLPKKKRDVRVWSYVRGASIFSLNFFSKHGAEEYYWNDIKTGIKPNHLQSQIFDCLRELEPYCMFNAESFVPENPVKSFGHLLISICLKDEYLANNDYDFVATIRVECPLGAHEGLERSIAYKKSKQQSLGETIK